MLPKLQSSGKVQFTSIYPHPMQTDEYTVKGTGPCVLALSMIFDAGYTPVSWRDHYNAFDITVSPKPNAPIRQKHDVCLSDIRSLCGSLDISFQELNEANGLFSLYSWSDGDRIARVLQNEGFNVTDTDTRYGRRYSDESYDAVSWVEFEAPTMQFAPCQPVWITSGPYAGKSGQITSQDPYNIVDGLWAVWDTSDDEYYACYGHELTTVAPEPMVDQPQPAPAIFAHAVEIATALVGALMTVVVIFGLSF